MEAQLRLAEACINDMEEEAGHIAEAIADADVYVDEEEFWDEPEEMPVNVPKWYN